MNKLAGYVSLLILLASCQSEKSGDTSARQLSVVADSARFVTDTVSLAEEVLQRRDRLAREKMNVAAQEADTTVTIRFREVTLHISPVRPNEETPRITPLLNADSLTIGQNQYTQGGLRIATNTSILSNVIISERVGVVLTVSQDDMTYTFDETLHYSPWRPLKQVGRQQFTSNAYSEQELIQALNLSLSQIKRLIRQRGDSLSYATVRSLRSLTELKTAENMTVAYYCLRITGQRKDTGQLITKYIFFENQIGC